MAQCECPSYLVKETGEYMVAKSSKSFYIKAVEQWLQRYSFSKTKSTKIFFCERTAKTRFVGAIEYNVFFFLYVESV